MSTRSSIRFFAELDRRCDIIKDYILDSRFVNRFNPEEIRWAVTAYVRYGGKRLRPAIVLFSAGAVGGDEARAIPAAAAVEIFHTWTLVHDDIIDRDNLRRGQSTVHDYYHRESLKPGAGLGFSESEAQHYGVSLAILTGDIQHGWGISMMTELVQRGVDPVVTLKLIDELDTVVLNTLVEGEVLDIQYAHRPVESLGPEQIEEMLWKKTGALYEFCGRAGALIGVDGKDDPLVSTVGRFAALCGTAFQLQDDILGVIGNQDMLGKPVGSDLREGKRTLVIHYAWQRANEEQRAKLLSVLGNSEASDSAVREATALLRDLGAVGTVAERAKLLVSQALDILDGLPATRYRDLLGDWAEYMIQREF
jgi:geranylgeranyl diphosphate synthase type I